MKWLDKNIWWLCAIAIIGPFWGWAMLVVVWVWPLAFGGPLAYWAGENYPNLQIFGFAMMSAWLFYFMFLVGMTQRKEIPEWWIWLLDQTIINLL